MNLKLFLAILLVPLVGWAAGELTLTTSFVYNKNGVTLQNSRSGTITVSGTPVASGVVSVSTNYTAISFGTVTNSGYALLINATTNSWSEISWGTVSNQYPFKLKANEGAVFRFNTNSLSVIATTNASDLQYIILSN